jgi:hypothetical protein
MATPGNPEPAPASDQNSKFVLVPEEIDSTKLKMPPWVPIGIVLVVIFIGVGIASYIMRPKPKALGTIEDVYGVAMPGGGVMATIKVDLRNVGKKPLWIRDITAKLTTQKGEFSDEAANAVDFPRYLEAFPDLSQHTVSPMKGEDKINPGSHEEGSIIVTFPVSVDEFNARKSISAVIQPYDQAPVTITK